MTFDVQNTGLGTLTNVRIEGVTPSNGGVALITAFPAAISPSSLSEDQIGTGSFSFTAGGLTAGETLTFQVEVIADEMSEPHIVDLAVTSTETDLTFVPSHTYSFESDDEGWTTVQGTFNRSSSGGGSHGAWYEQSSAYLDNQCDQIVSPTVVFSATTTLSLSSNYDIEPLYQPYQEWYDRANVGIVPVATGSRAVVSPDSGRLYNAGGVNGNCGTSNQAGWADAATSWDSSDFSAAALGSAGLEGAEVQIDIRYGTDASLNGYGFRFDEVTLTNFSIPGADSQGDFCSVGCTVDTDCDDGAYCNGIEICNAGTCQAGTPPSPDDGVGCTVDSCNEATDSFDHTPDDGVCDDGAFCNGAETCDPVQDCQAGTPPDPDDGVECTVDSCDEATDSFDHTPDDGICDDGAFCNGAETCDPVQDCQAGSYPCLGGELCNETSDMCEAPEAPSVHVVSVVTGTVNADIGRGNKQGTATVTLAGNDIPGSEYTVSGHFGGSFDPEIPYSGSTTDGIITFTSEDSGKGVTVTFCISVSGVVGPDPYNPANNGAGVETCGETPAPVCGDGICNGNEDSTSCSVDCPAPPSCVPTHSKEKGPRCSDTLDNDCDGLTDLDDPDCQ
jgi:hypothetical protein